MLKRLHPAALSLVLLLELPFLGWRPLTRDEAISIQAAQRDWGAFWGLLHHLDAPLGLYYLLLRPVVAVSDGAFAVRLPSLLGAVAAVAVLAVTIARRFGRVAGFWAASVMLANPALWFFADFARPYALALAAASVTGYVLLVRPDRTVLYWAAAVLTLYLQLLFSLFLCAQAAVLLYQRRFRLFLTLCMAGLTAVPLLVVASGESVMTSWIPYTSVTSLRVELFNLFGAAAGLSAAVAAVSLVPVVAALRLREARLLVLAGLLPALVLAVAGLRLHVLGSRYALYVLLCLAGAAGLGLAQLRSKSLQAGMATLLGVCMIASGVHLARLPYEQEDLRSAASYLTRHASVGDAMLYDPDWARPGMQYWLDHTRGNKPDDVALRPGSSPRRTANLFLPELPTTAVQQALADRTRVWVIGYPGQIWRPTANTAGDLAEVLRRSWTEQSRAKFGEVELLLLTRTA